MNSRTVEPNRVRIRDERRRVLKLGRRRYPEEPVPVLEWQVDQLFGHFFRWDRARLLASLSEPFPVERRSEWEGIIERWLRGEPLAYILGRWGFWDLVDLQIEPGVFIPRPESETLIEAVLAHRPDCDVSGWMADVGTGSGALAIALARAYTRVRMVAVDISDKALGVARRNARHFGVDGRIGFIRMDLLSGFRKRPSFDVIVANPPYIPASGFHRLPASVREYEPYEALVPECGYPAIYDRLAMQAARCLRPGGILVCEVGAGQAPEVIERLRGYGEVLEVRRDLMDIPRVIVWKPG